ncbi:sigma-70 family RNA polymerase sigma factor [Aureliella helgolandensis]|uniref:RNA polymerase sigma factor n=1 Tax=Aureliella helgolandensis TaxID=2527968 RepID=A0A518G2E3_9BACT|nr:sigma-70 family RNA polymerase sigma factor [Aureliella helgolandensis]QDV22730.1 RNA polymerase sigma factor [Aureliella helgolandensis]
MSGTGFSEVPFVETSQLYGVHATQGPHLTDVRDHARFLRLYTTHEAVVRAYVRRLVPGRVDADDVMQEVALVLWAKFGIFRENGDFRNWAFGIARFEVLAWLRDRSRDRLVLDGDVAELIAEEALEDLTSLDQRRTALADCLEKMPLPQRRLLLESYQADCKIQEVAVSSGRSVAGFYQWLHRMRRTLLNCVQQQVAHFSCH